VRAVIAAAAAACAAAGVVLAWHYPIAPTLAVAAFLGWSAVCWRWPFAWLTVIPALLPICGFATWTGWFAFEELDLLILGAAAGGYAWLASRPRGETSRTAILEVRASPLSITLVLLFAASCAISLYRGIAAFGSPEVDWIGNYESAMNSVRLFKSFVSALLLWPILRSTLELDHRRALDSLAFGVALGLGGASLAALWERAAFTDVLNFSSDYRTTALFWEMHVGGAALDGFLALAAPFAVWEIRRATGPLRVAAALLLSAVAAYACLTTFSRGLYVALAASLGLLWLLMSRQRPGIDGVLVRMGKGVVLATIAAAAFYFVFRFGGYRALLAFVVTLGMAMHITSTADTHRVGALELLAASAIGLLLGALGAFIAALIPKGPYVVFAAAFACNAGNYLLNAPPVDSKRTVLCWGLLVWLAVAATLVASHWGGPEALRDSALATTFLIVAAAVNRLLNRSWVPQSERRRLAWVGISALLAGGVGIFAGGAYMGDRLSASSEDLDARMRHWGNGTAMLRGTGEWWLGKGFGTFPVNYFFGVPDGVFPGSFALHQTEGGRYLSLAGPRYPTSWGDLFRVSQRVPTIPGTYTALLDIRSVSHAQVHLEVCEQHLLYNGACGTALVFVRGGSQWQRVSTQLDARALSRGPWYAPRLSFFSMAVGASSQSVDIREVALMGPDGSNRLVNGDFGRGLARWIPISEKYHLPWHIKSLVLDLIFDQGIVGLTLFVLLWLTALGRMIWGDARSHPLAPFLAAGLTGFMVVGCFDSLLDVPRVAFLFYLFILASLILPRWAPSAPAENP
jgi:hypothetical protein